MTQFLSFFSCFTYGVKMIRVEWSVSNLLEWLIKLTKDLQIGYWINFISFAYSLS